MPYDNVMQVFINNAGIDRYNYVARNGIFHVIDKVGMDANEILYLPHSYTGAVSR